MKKVLVLFCMAALLMSPLSAMGVQAAAPTPEKFTPLHNTAVTVATTQTAHLTIPASAFTPYEDGYDFQNHGRYLKHFHSPNGGNGRGWYLAPVNLPNGAIVTRVTFYYRDNSGANGVARLQRTNLEGNFETMASVDTSGNWAQYWLKSTAAINYSEIDNAQHAYWVIWDLPCSSEPPNEQSVVWGISVVIDYIPPPASTRGILSVPAAAFKPYEDGHDFQNDGRYLEYLGGGTHGWYMAAVHLPQGATVTKVTFYYFTETIEIGSAKLQRADSEGNYQNMAVLESTAGSGYSQATTSNISHPKIDNTNYSYWIVWDLVNASHNSYVPLGAVKGCAVTIEYTLSATGNVITIPAAAFTPYEDGYDFQNDGRYLQHFLASDGHDTSGWYFAPVNLPDGVTVDEMLIHFAKDTTSTHESIVKLQRSDMQGHYEDMASLSTMEAPPEWGYLGERNVHARIINNATHSYWVIWVLPPHLHAGGVLIYYSYKMYFPMLSD